MYVNAYYIYDTIYEQETLFWGSYHIEGAYIFFIGKTLKPIQESCRV